MANDTDSTDFSLHLPGMKYCGPGTDLSVRLNSDGTPKPGWEPVDRIDEAALKHDLFYTKHTSQRVRAKIGDKQMIDEINNIPNVTCRECVERFIVVTLLTIKRHLTLFTFRVIDWFLGRRIATGDEH